MNFNVYIYIYYIIHNNQLILYLFQAFQSDLPLLVGAAPRCWKLHQQQPNTLQIPALFRSNQCSTERGLRVVVQQPCSTTRQALRVWEKMCLFVEGDIFVGSKRRESKKKRVGKVMNTNLWGAYVNKSILFWEDTLKRLLRNRTGSCY